MKWIVFYVACMIISGTVNTITTKMQFTTVSIDKDGNPEPFSKPWFATLNMLLAMFLVGIVDKAVRTCRPADNLAPDGEYQALPAEGGKAAVPYLTKVYMVAVPAFFDLLATAFCCIGMLYIPASVWQMLKGGSIIFCGIGSVLFLKRKLYAFHWVGLFFCVAGLCTVGMSSVLGNSSQPNAGDSGDLFFGMALVMAGQVVQAGQLIAEEYLMKDVDLPAMQIVGWEGFWGTLMMLICVYPFLWMIPGSDHGHLEDIVDTFTMIGNSTQLFWLVMLYLCSCGSFNASGIAVTGALSATHRMMMDASRTSVIWCFGLTVHYYINPDSPYGEAWTSYSYLQLVGFTILVAGQAMYGEILKIPGVYYPPAALDARTFASPASLHSPMGLPRAPEPGQ